MDTGATFSGIPRGLAVELGLQAEYEAEVELADGQRIERVYPWWRWKR